MKKLTYEYMCFSLRDAFEGINLPEGLSGGSKERLSRAIYHCSLPRNDSTRLSKRKKWKKESEGEREKRREKTYTMDVRKSGRRPPLCGPKNPK